MARQKQSRLSPEAQARVDFVNSIVPKSSRGLKAWIFWAIGLGLTILVVWLIFFSGQSEPKVKLKPKIVAPSASTLRLSEPLKNYSSPNFNMSLAYPKSWQVTDNKSSLIITSPLVNLVMASGNSVKGHIGLNVVKAGALPAPLTSGTDLAVLDSSLSTYSQPSSNQAGQTYLSYVQYSTTNIKGGLDAIYVTGNLGYQKDQIIAPSDLSSLDPLIYVNFTDCTDAFCKSLGPLTLASSSWNGSPLGQIVTAIIQSMVFN